MPDPAQLNQIHTVGTCCLHVQGSYRMSLSSPCRFFTPLMTRGHGQVHDLIQPIHTPQVCGVRGS